MFFCSRSCRICPLIFDAPPLWTCRKMLTLPIQQAKYENGIDPMHATTNGCHVDPRSIAQRILAVSYLYIAHHYLMPV